MATSLLVVLGAIGAIYNKYVYVKHFIHLLYFVRDFDDDEKSMFDSFSSNLPSSMRKSPRSSSKVDNRSKIIQESNEIELKEGGDEDKDLENGDKSPNIS
jgi:hypothetical protein